MNDDQSKQLYEYLDKRFTENDDQSTRLYAYMEQRFDEIDKRFDTVATKDSVDRLASTVDSLIGYYKDSQVEQAAQDAKWERLLDWAREVSKKTGVPLKDL